jgi:putative iron-regulated protein
LLHGFPTSKAKSTASAIRSWTSGEGKVNAWPLDEGLIDYVDASYGTESDSNALYVANVVANPKLSVNGEEIDASSITPELLRSLHETGEIEANVATGYHAIEFLLWGQDLNGTDAGAGNRSHTDFDPPPIAPMVIATGAQPI